MKKIKYSLAALGLVGALTLSGCKDNPAGNSGAYANPSVSYANSECTATPDNTVNTVYPTTDGTGIHVIYAPLTSRVVAHVFITCLPSPYQHFLDLELWFHALTGSGKFVEVASMQYKSIPNQQNPTDFMTSRWCEPGMWQLRWSVVGKDSMQAPFAYSDKWKIAIVKYSDCQKEEKSPAPTGNATGGDEPVLPE